MMAAAWCNCIVFWCFLHIGLKVCPDVCCMQYRQGRCLYDFYLLKLTWVSKQQIKNKFKQFPCFEGYLATSTSGPSWGLFEGYLGCGTERCREFGGGEVAQEGLAAKVIIETHSGKFFLGWEGGRGLVPRSHIFMAQQTMANENRGLLYHHGSLVYTELNSRVGVFHCILYTPHQKKEMEYLFSTF